jgi:hypothetical protein
VRVEARKSRMAQSGTAVIRRGPWTGGGRCVGREVALRLRHDTRKVPPPHLHSGGRADGASAYGLRVQRAEESDPPVDVHGDDAGAADQENEQNSCTRTFADLSAFCDPTYSGAVGTECEHNAFMSGHGTCGAFLVSYNEVGASFTACFYDSVSEKLVGVLAGDDTLACGADGGSFTVQGGQVDPTCGGLSPGQNVAPHDVPSTDCGDQDAATGSDDALVSADRADD